MTHKTARGVLALIAALCAVTVTIVSSSSARADDGGAQGYWDKYVAPAFDDETGVDGSTNPISSPFDKVYNFIFGTTDTVGFTSSGDTCYLGTPGCNEVVAGYAPSPGGVAPTFVRGAEVAGVTVKAGNATVTGAGMLFNMTGAAASHLTVDTDTTDLVVDQGAPPGWVGGDNVLGSHLTVSVVTVPASGVAGNVTVSVTRSFCGATIGSQNDQCWKDVFGTGNQGQFNVLVKDAAGANVTGGVSTAVLALTGIKAGYTGTLTFGPLATGWTSFEIVSVGAGTSGFPSETIKYCAPGTGCYESGAGSMVGAVESTYVCRTQAGETHTTNASVAVNEGLGQVPVELPSFSCAADELLLSALVEWVTDEGRQTIYDYEAPSWVQDTPAEWQDCGTKNCELKLYHEGTYCGENAVGCPEWWEEDADGYTCKYGSHAVDLNYCAIYRVPGQKSPSGKVSVDIDGDLNYETPEGKSRSWFDTLPKAPPAAPVTPTDPVPPDVALPVEPGGGDPSTDTGKCFPSGWGAFNPLEWVYRPVTCALTWAFVPRQAIVRAQLEAGTDALEGNGILAVVPAAIAVPGQVSTGWSDGCSSNLGDFAVTTSAGTWFAALPCDVGDVAPAWSGQYSSFYTFATVFVVASGAWGVFIVIRRYFGAKDGGDE